VAADANEIIRRLKNPPPKGKRVTLYLNAISYERARELCAKSEISISNVVSAYLSDFAENAGRPGAKKASPEREKLLVLIDRLPPDRLGGLIDTVQSHLDSIENEAKDRSGGSGAG
jgi:hypothetical protein